VRPFECGLCRYAPVTQVCETPGQILRRSTRDTARAGLHPVQTGLASSSQTPPKTISANNTHAESLSKESQATSQRWGSDPSAHQERGFPQKQDFGWRWTSGQLQNQPCDFTARGGTRLAFARATPCLKSWTFALLSWQGAGGDVPCCLTGLLLPSQLSNAGERARCPVGWRLWQLCIPVVAASGVGTPCSLTINLLQTLREPCLVTVGGVKVKFPQKAAKCCAAALVPLDSLRAQLFVCWEVSERCCLKSLPFYVLCRNLATGSLGSFVFCIKIPL